VANNPPIAITAAVIGSSARPREPSISEHERVEVDVQVESAELCRS
jgi:hypothetical protein